VRILPPLVAEEGWPFGSRVEVVEEAVFQDVRSTGPLLDFRFRLVW